MQAKEGVLDLLNGSLTIELTAVNQYFLAAEQCANWGFPRLRKRFRSISMEEMHDVENLVQHILYLDGLPNMQRLNQIQVGENVLELMQAGLTAEHAAVEHLRRAIAHCHNVGDFTTRAIFEEMIQGEERHLDMFETQLSAIQLVGLERYLSQQVSED
jgi:bacterioferritin